MDLKNKLVNKKLNYVFRNEELLSQALTHSSYSNKVNNLGLEFLGDSVLSLVVADCLMRSRKNNHAGSLTKLRSQIVNNENLAKTLKLLELDNYIVLGKGQTLNQNICADVFESIIGAIFIDGGYASAYMVINLIFKKFWSSLYHNSDYKTQLQEYVQQKFECTPDYRVLKVSGPDHDQTFLVGVFVDKEEIARGKGSNKKNAEQSAAQKAFKTYQGA